MYKAIPIILLKKIKIWEKVIIKRWKWKSSKKME